MKNKLIFWGLWLVLLSLAPITILKSIDLPYTIAHPLVLVNVFQRFVGLMAFTLIFWQLMLGAYMQRWTEKFGGWVLRFHITEGIIIYLLVLLHPIFFMLLNYFYGLGFDPFYVFTQICVICKQQELYYTLGRISFWLVNVTVFAGLFRMSTPFMRANWKKFHVLNYLVFLLIGIHGLSIGTDFMVMPFFAFAIVAYTIVLYTVARKLPGLFSFLKNWIKS
jgi:hypothetical protein